MKNTFKIYDSLSKSEMIYDSLGKNIINIYSCGPTVYDHSHIGHARASITWDFIVRFLRFIGFKVIWTRNITDIDDKIIKKSSELNLHPDKVARIFSHSYHEDMIALNVDWPDFEPCATQYLPNMFNFIQKLIDKGSAYVIDSDVYFSVQSYFKYGCLKGQSISELEKGFGRIEPNPKKKHPLDFALWKGIKDSSDYSFQSPWGMGRPGWHLECSAMCDSIYSTNLDIHCGGDDLIFPHHENEIAQSEMATGPFARYWLHNGMIMVDGKKMAKSDGNFITIKQALKSTSGNAIRFFVLNSHYRMPLNYTFDGIQAAQNGISRISESLSDFSALPDYSLDFKNEYVQEFIQVMSNDFNSPQALSVLFKLVDKINLEKNTVIRVESQFVLLSLASTLGFNFLSSVSTFSDIVLGKIVENLLSVRNTSKVNKDYRTADNIRDVLLNSNIEIKDLPGGEFKWRIKI